MAVEQHGSLCSLCSEAGKGARSVSGNHTFIQLKLTTYNGKEDSELIQCI